MKRSMAKSLVLEYASAFQNSLENVGLLVRNVNVKMRKNVMMLLKKCVRKCQMFSIKIVLKHVESVENNKKLKLTNENLVKS